MKKVILTLLTLLMVSPVAYNAYGDDKGGRTDYPKYDIILIKKKHRSLSEEITAAYYPAERIIEIEFNENIGTVAIKVANATGTTVYNAVHDTSAEAGCTIDIPQQNTTYTIDIAGSEYASVGYLYL